MFTCSLNSQSQPVLDEELDRKLQPQQHLRLRGSWMTTIESEFLVFLQRFLQSSNETVLCSGTLTETKLNFLGNL